MRSPRFLATSAAWRVGFIGPVGSSQTHGTRSGRRYQISFTRNFAREHGVVDVHSAVVRTTETMVIHTVLEHQERKRVRREARPWFLGSSSDLWQQENGLLDCRVIMWRVVVMMEQRHSTCRAVGPRYSTGTEGGREMKEGRVTSTSGRKGRT